MSSKKEFFLECYQLGILKFGKFTLKSGIESPFYVDLRPLASDPIILKKLALQLLTMVPHEKMEVICGVPYAALPMATAMSLESEIPLIIKRKEAKEYGTKKLIEGIYKAGQNCLLVEDVITSGKSLLETLSEVEKEGLKVTDIVVVLDREQGGKELLKEKGYTVHSLFTISEAVALLQGENLVQEDDVQRIHDFIAGNRVEFSPEKKLSYEEKLLYAEHPMAKKLLEIAITKCSNLIASADVTTTQELLDFAEKVGPHIVALKTHIDIIADFDSDKTILPLKDIAAKHNFLLMEDRKFGDIGNTQELQYTKGIYKISHWADLVTSHVIAGYQSIDCFRNSGVIAILSMSSKGALTDYHYRTEALKVIDTHPHIVGCVAQNRVSPRALLFTPGVNLDDKGDDKGQQYNTPDYVFNHLGTDFVIVGRGIYKANAVQEAAVQYQKASWKAYLKSLA